MFKCPKCHRGNLYIFEAFEVSDAIVVENGAVVARVGDQGASATGKFRAECDCGHKWRPRHETGIRAADDACALNEQ